MEDLEYLSFDKDSEEYKYLISLREKQLGGFLPKRTNYSKTKINNFDHFNEFDGSSSKREMSTTMVFVRIITSILKR